jgi:hypothetical protein
VLVPANFTLAQLHHAVQATLGWEDYHLHEFFIGESRFGVPDPNEAFMGESPTLNENNACLAQVLNKVGA